MLQDVTINETVIDVKRFGFDFFSINPRIIDEGNRLRVLTPLWRSCIGLISGYRSLEIDSSNFEMILLRRATWLFKYGVRLSLNEIRNIKPMKFTYPEEKNVGGDGWSGTILRYVALWSVYLVLESQGHMLPLFQWKKELGSEKKSPIPVSPFIYYEFADESYQERDYKRLVSKLCELTGKPVNWD